MPVILDLGEQLTISNVSDRHLAWRELADGDDDLAIDGGNIASVDSAGLQLLLALKRAKEQQARSFSWQACSDELIDIARLAGIADELELANG